VPQLRLALAQIDVTVGDIAGNADRILRWTRHAAASGAHVVAFPEMALTGYPVEDLALRGSFVAASRRALNDLAGRRTWTDRRRTGRGSAGRPGRRRTPPPRCTAAG